jgi:hypothetical protein
MESANSGRAVAELWFLAVRLSVAAQRDLLSKAFLSFP